MIVYQSCGKYVVSLYAGSTTAVINIYQINREHVHSSGVTTAPATPAMQGGGTLGGRHITKVTVF